MMTGADMMVAITRTRHTAADPRRLSGSSGLSGGSDDAAVAQRLLAPILDGHNSGFRV